MRPLALFNILVALWLLAGCTSNTSYVSVVDHKSPASTKVSYHYVAKGETLYSIAWRYNLDYVSLAKINNIGPGYTIYPGQKLYLKQVLPYVKPHLRKPSPPVVKKTVTTKSHTQVVENKPPVRLKNKSQPSEKPTVQKLGKSTPSWVWPANGKILSHFNTKGGLNKGIDIGGKLGEPVRAAASGTVVYSGEGLRGYGKLIIIKHDDQYLSAYAHNHKLKVKEGDEVNRNEKIAEMGGTGTNSVKLHFEIRYDGKPVNPLKYLPKK